MTMDLQNKTYPAKSAQQMMDLTIEWANKAGFYESTTPEIQLEKFREEHNEVLYAVKGYYGQLTIEETELADLSFMGSGADSGLVDEYWLDQIKDGVGDSMVTYFIQCGLRGFTPTINDNDVQVAMIEHFGLTTDSLTMYLDGAIEYTESGDPATVITGITTATKYAMSIGLIFGFTPEECWNHAYSIISKRVGKGKVVNGTFYKEDDLDDGGMPRT